MTRKHFPTPNLDAWNTDEDNCTEFLSHEDAVQADISLALEAARVEAPDDIRETLEAALYHVGKCVNGCQGEVTTARRWLESLRPAKASDAVEKRCGTCAHSFELSPTEIRCDYPLPLPAWREWHSPKTNGADCPCWKARTP